MVFLPAFCGLEVWSKILGSASTRLAKCCWLKVRRLCAAGGLFRSSVSIWEFRGQRCRRCSEGDVERGEDGGMGRVEDGEMGRNRGAGCEVCQAEPVEALLL